MPPMPLDVKEQAGRNKPDVGASATLRRQAAAVADAGVGLGAAGSNVRNTL